MSYIIKIDFLIRPIQSYIEIKVLDAHNLRFTNTILALIFLKGSGKLYGYEVNNVACIMGIFVFIKLAAVVRMDK
jgi:hypothetical protein